MVNPRLCRGTHRVWHFRDAWVVARGQGPSGQKASAGRVLFQEAWIGLRRLGRADRATGRSPLPAENTFHQGFGWLARLIHEMEAASWFLPRRSLPPGLATSRNPPLGGAHFNPLWAVPCCSCLRLCRRYLT